MEDHGQSIWTIQGVQGHTGPYGCVACGLEVAWRDAGRRRRRASQGLREVQSSERPIALKLPLRAGLTCTSANTTRSGRRSVTDRASTGSGGAPARNGAVMPSPKQLLVNLTSAPWDAPGSPGRGEAASPSGRRSSPLDLRRKIQVSSPSPPAVPSPLASPSPSQENHTRKVCGAVEVLARALSRLLGAAGGPVAVGSASTCKPRLFGKRALPRSSLWLVSLTVLTLVLCRRSATRRPS